MSTTKQSRLRPWIRKLLDAAYTVGLTILYVRYLSGIRLLKPGQDDDTEIWQLPPYSRFPLSAEVSEPDS